jgi:hypothetical protein
MKKIWVFMVVVLLLSLYVGSCTPKPSTEGKPVLPEQYLYVTMDENGEMALNQRLTCRTGPVLKCLSCYLALERIFIAEEY